MLCHIAPPHTAHHVRCGVLCHVFCDMEWVCGMWCGAMWNVIQCHHTMLCHSAPPHIAQHSRIAQHHISLHNIPHLFTLHSTDHALPHRTTTYCTSCDVMRCVMCHVIWNGAWSGVWYDVEWDVTHYTTCFATSHNCILQCVMCFCDMAHVECGVVQDVAQCGMGCGMFTMLLQHTLCLIAPLQNAHHSCIIPHITQHLYVTHYTPCNMCCCDVTRSGAWCGM